MRGNIPVRGFADLTIEGLAVVVFGVIAVLPGIVFKAQSAPKSDHVASR